MGQRIYSVQTDGPRIDAFLKRILQLSGLKLKYEIGAPNNADSDFETPEIVVRFSGPDLDDLLANRAELLLALEQITSEMLRMAADEHSQLQFDARDYRALRIEELRLSALTAAEKVKQTRRPFVFNPMNSRERRIIHIALRNDSGVRSESAGVGPARQVVIYPAGMPSMPFVPAAPPPFRGGRRR
ncbi:MAG: single-stranded DNA-binding protein [Acidobacteria bacterium]|nr:single-stranded DNA-binding protein [Acidobacteriota bacterium]